jgi:type I restriction enzyme S subunit
VSLTKICKLEEVIKIQNGFAFSSKNFSVQDGIPLIRIRDLKNGVTTQTKYSGDFDKEYLVESGDLLIGMDGEFKCYEWRGGPALLNQRVCRIQKTSHELDLKYLFYGINSHLKAIEDVTGYTTVKHLSSTTILNIEFPIPTLQNQRKIVEKLDKAFAEIDSLEKNLQLKEEKTNQLLQSMLSAAFTNSEEFDMKVVKLGQICELISRGISPTYCDNSDLIVINQRCIRNNDLDLTFSKYHNENSKKVNETKYLKYGDGLINSTGVGTLGRTATFAIDNKLKYTVDSHVTIARPKLDQIDPGYFKLMLKSLETKFVELATGTSGQTELPRENLNNIEVIVCEKKKDQRKLANNILNSFAQIDKLKNQISIEKERISSLRQSILSNALNFNEKAA